MRLGEAVGGELRDLLEDRGRELLRHAARDRALDEGLALGVHLGLDLLAHGAAQKVGAAQRVARELAGDLHHLLLVDDDAVGLLQDRLEQRVQILGLLDAVLAVDVARDVVHRPRPIERVHGDDVVEAVRLELAQRIAHAAGFQLEHAGGLAAAQEVEGRRIVERQGRELEPGAALVDQALGQDQEGERGQAEEVELDQARLLDVLHVELGDRHVGARVAVQRHQLVERPVADHDAGGVGGGVARQALELLRDRDQAADLLVLARRIGEPGLELESLLQRRRMGRVERHQLGDPVDLAVGHAEGTADVAQHRARLQLAEGDDRRDPALAVFGAHVADHLVAPVLAEVDVEVRHRHPLGIEEALEQQAKAERIEVGDRERPGDHGAGARAAPRADRDAAPLGPADEVGDDQEVAFVLHADDDVQLVLQSLTIRRCERVGIGRRHPIGGEPVGEPGLGLDAKLARLVPAGRGRKIRQDRRPGRDHEAATLRDHQAVLCRLGQIGEQLDHLGSTLEAVLGRQPAALLLADLRAIGDAQEDVVRLVLGGVDEMDVVGRDQRQVAAEGQVDQGRLDLLLGREPVAHQLDVEAAREQRRQLGQQRLGEAAIAVHAAPGRPGPRDRR